MITLVVALGAAVAGGGCVLHARAQPTVAPPPPQYVEVDYRPGYVWVQGRWVWGYSGWQWQRGYWVAERPGFYYTQGHWTNRGGRHVWVNGSWTRGRAPRGVYQRDHRRSNRNVRGVWKRDHRGKKAAPPRRGKQHRAKPGDVFKRDHRAKKKKERKKEKKEKPRIRRRDHR